MVFLAFDIIQLLAKENFLRSKMKEEKLTQDYQQNFFPIYPGRKSQAWANTLDHDALKKEISNGNENCNPNKLLKTTWRSNKSFVSQIARKNETEFLLSDSPQSSWTATKKVSRE